MSYNPASEVYKHILDDKYIRDKLQESREQAQNTIDSGRFFGTKLRLAKEFMKYFEDHLEENNRQMAEGLPRYMYPPHGEILLKKLELLQKLDDNQIDQVMKLVGRIEHAYPDIKKYSQNVSDAVTQITDGVFGTRTEQDARSHGNPLVDNTKVTKVSNGYKNIEPVRAVNDFLCFLSEASKNVIPLGLQPAICFPNGFFGWVAGFAHKIFEVNNFFARICHIDIIGIATFLTQKIQCWVMPNSPHHQVYKGIDTAKKNMPDLANTFRLGQRSFTDPAKKLSADQVKLLAGILDSRKLCSSSIENTHYLNNISYGQRQIINANLASLNLGANIETGEYPSEREAVLKSFQGHQLAANSLDMINGAKLPDAQERSEQVMKLISVGAHVSTNNLQVAVGLGKNQQDTNTLFNQSSIGTTNMKDYLRYVGGLMRQAGNKVARISREYPYDKATAKFRGISEKLAQTNPYVNSALSDIQHIGSDARTTTELMERVNNPGDATNTNVSLNPDDRKLFTAADIGLRFGGVAIALALQVTSPLILIPSLLLFKPIMTTIRNKLVDNDIVGWIANSYIFKNSGDVGNKTLKLFRSLEHGANTKSMNSAAMDLVMAFAEFKAFADRALTSPDSAKRFSALGKNIAQAAHVMASIALKSGDGVIGPSILYELENRTNVTIPADVRKLAKQNGGITADVLIRDVIEPLYDELSERDVKLRYANTTGTEYKKVHTNPLHDIQRHNVPMGSLSFYRNSTTGKGMTVEQCLNNEVSEFYGLVLDPVKMQQLQNDVSKMAAFRAKVEQWKQEKIEIAKNSDDSLSSHEWKKKLEEHHKKYYDFIKEIVSYTVDPEQNGVPIISARYQEASMEEAMDWRKKEADYLVQLGLISDDPNDVHPLFDPMVYKGLGMKPDTYVTLQVRTPETILRTHDDTNDLPYETLNGGFTKVARPYIISKEDIQRNGVPDPTYRSKNHVQFIQWSGVENGQPKHWHSESGQLYKPAAQIAAEAEQFQRVVALHNMIKADEQTIFTDAADGALGVRVFLLHTAAQLKEVSAKTKCLPPSWLSETEFDEDGNVKKKALLPSWLSRPMRKFWGWLFRNREKSLEPAFKVYTKNDRDKEGVTFAGANRGEEKYHFTARTTDSEEVIKAMHKQEKPLNLGALIPQSLSGADQRLYEGDDKDIPTSHAVLHTGPPKGLPTEETEVLNRRIQQMEQKQGLTLAR
jgi:hypothetical protein